MCGLSAPGSTQMLSGHKWAQIAFHAWERCVQINCSPNAGLPSQSEDGLTSHTAFRVEVISKPRITIQQDLPTLGFTAPAGSFPAICIVEQSRIRSGSVRTFYSRLAIVKFKGCHSQNLPEVITLTFFS